MWFNRPANPGINWDHPACKNIRFSFAQPQNGGTNVIDLTTNTPGTLTGNAPTAIIDPIIGPALRFPSSSGGNYQWSGRKASNDPVATCGFIAKVVANGSYANVFTTDSNAPGGGSNGFFFDSTGGGVAIAVGGSGFSGRSLTAGLYYFVGISCRATGSGSFANYVARRLDVGTITTTRATATVTSSAPNGTYQLMSATTNYDLAALLYSTEQMLPAQLLAWAQDPWGPWRPPQIVYRIGSASTGAAVGAASGTAAVSGVGASEADSTAAATGTGTVAGVGASAAASVGAASGTATVSGVGAILRSGVGAATGTGTVTAVGASRATAKGTATGTGSALGTGVSAAAAKGAASGIGTALGTGASLTKAVGTATGVGSATAFSPGGAKADAAGSAAVSGVGASLFEAVGVAAGTGTALGVAPGVSEAVGIATGSANVVGIGFSTGGTAVDTHDPGWPLPGERPRTITTTAPTPLGIRPKRSQRTPVKIELEIAEPETASSEIPPIQTQNAVIAPISRNLVEAVAGKPIEARQEAGFVPNPEPLRALAARLRAEEEEAALLLLMAAAA